MKPDINYALSKKNLNLLYVEAAKMEAAAQKPVGSAYTEDQV